MKLIRRMIALSIVTFAVFYGVFFYINKYILTTDNVKISSQKVETKSLPTPVKIYIPNYSENVKVSFDGGYLSYEEGNLLHIVDTNSGDKKEIKLDNKISFYNWLPDRNRVLIIESYKKNGRKNFILDYYDADRDETDKITDFYASDTTMEIDDVKLSTLTNSIFIKAAGNDGKARIYYMNIMKKLKKLQLKTKNIGDIEAIQHQTHMVYEDKRKGKIYVTGGGNPLVIDNVNTEALLGIDNDDNIYIGDVRNNQIAVIYTKSMDSEDNAWRPYLLRQPVNRSDIFISKTGQIYVNHAIEGRLQELKSDKSITYEGEFLQVIDDGITSNKDGELVIKTIKSNNESVPLE